MEVPKNRLRTTCADKNDKLAWSVGESYKVYGLTVGLRSNSDVGIEALRKVLPPCPEATDAAEVDFLASFWLGRSSKGSLKHYHLGYLDWTQVSRSLDLTDSLAQLQRAFWADLAMCSPQLCGVSGYWKQLQDREWVFVLPTATETSSRGASTLTIDANNDFLTFDGETLHRRPKEVHLVRPSNKTDHSRLNILSEGQAVLGLIEACPCFRLWPGLALRRLSVLARSVPIVEVGSASF